MNTILDDAAARLRAAGVESPRLEARLLLAHAMGVDPATLVSSPDHTGRNERFDAMLQRRLAGEPMAYILGKKEFWSLDFAVGPGVLVPRPESETLVEAALRAFPDRDAALNVLDLGTGSGCLLLAFLSERPHARGFGIDGSDDALTYARRNARDLSLEQRAEFSRGEWTSGLRDTFDVILVNPPYLTTADLEAAPAELRYEPRAALLAGDDGLDAYLTLGGELPRMMDDRSRAFIELGQGQAEGAIQLFLSAGLETVGQVPDLSNIPRCLVLALPGDGQKAIGKAKKTG